MLATSLLKVYDLYRFSMYYGAVTMLDPQADPGAPAATPVPRRATFESAAEALAVLQPVMRGIAEAVGRHCEVVLHDLQCSPDLGHTIVAIYNGHVSGRTVGGPSTNLGLELLNDEASDHDDFGYRGRTADGRELHSSSIYYHNAAGHPVAALCINVDLTPLQVMQSAISSFLPQTEQAPKEIIAPDIATTLDEMITEAIRTAGKTVPAMDRSDRIELLRVLDARGAFRIKRSVDSVARRLGISRVTAYSYLHEIRNE